MKGKSADLEYREKAFAAYRDSGGNVEAAIRAMKAQGYTISKPTFYSFIEQFNFKERLAAADVKTQEARDAAISEDEKIVADLMRQKAKYEHYFETLGTKVDNQAQYAYTSLVTAIVNIKAGLGADRGALSLQFLKDLVLFLQKEDPSSVPVIEKHLDAFGAFVKERYAG